MLHSFPTRRSSDLKQSAKRKHQQLVKEAGKKDVEKLPPGPLHIIISIKKQQMTLYAGGQPVAHSPVSTGVPGHPTPMGVFSVIEKQIYHESNLYSSAPMPYMQRITWSGVAMPARKRLCQPKPCVPRTSRPVISSCTITSLQTLPESGSR